MRIALEIERGRHGHLAQELGLDLDNPLAAEANDTDPCNHFDGEPYS
jgi:hypothetical protein